MPHKRKPTLKPGDPGFFKSRDVVLFKEGQFPRDAYTVEETLPDGGITMFPTGGGRIYRVHPDQLRADNFRVIDPKTHPRTWRKARFHLETPDETPTTYEGYTDGTRYNGWDVPFFPLAVAERIAQALGGAYDSARGAIVFPPGAILNDEEIYEGELIPEACSESLFCLGAGGWVWFETESAQ
jgi:hypothetical protein